MVTERNPVRAVGEFPNTNTPTAIEIEGETEKFS